MLYLVGVGLYDEKDITWRGMEVLESCDRIYAELYTSRWLGLEALERELDRDITELDRSGMEEDASELIDEAFNEDVAVLVPGDPLIATTHVSVLLEAHENGVETRVVHAPSVYSAIGATGLSVYRFGKTCTIPRTRKGYAPTSFYDIIVENQRVGAHTLCLLDVPMPLHEGLERLEEAEESHGKGVVRPGTELVAASFGSTDTVVCDTVENLKETEFPVPAVVVVPSDINDMEERMLEVFRT